MTNRTKQGPIARVNALLKKAGRPERVIKGHGYLYFIDVNDPKERGVSVFLGSIYTMNLENTEEDFQYLRSEVNDCFERYNRECWTGRPKAEVSI